MDAGDSSKANARKVITDSLFEYFSETDRPCLDVFMSQLDGLVPEEVRFRVPAWADMRRLICPTVGGNDLEAKEPTSDGTPQDCMADCILFCENAQKKLEDKRTSLQRFIDENLLQYGPMAEERAILFNECDKEIKKWRKLHDQLLSLFNGQDCPGEDAIDEIGRIIDRNLAAYKTRCSPVRKKKGGLRLSFANRSTTGQT